MKLAFVLYKYFPFGGLQRDFLRIATECQKRGHSIRVYTSAWEGEQPEGFEIIQVPLKGFSSPSRNRAFVSFMQQHRQDYPTDYCIGFNKIPGLDCYYAADGCFLSKVKRQSAWHQLRPRVKHFKRYEEAIFGKGRNTEILMISDSQIKIYQDMYDTEAVRFHMLPPGITRDRAAPDNAAEIRNSLRSEFDIKTDEWLWLMVGSGFKTKGADRSIRALQALPEETQKKVKLFIIGQDNPRPFARLAAKLGVASQVRFLKGRDDIPRFLLGADILVHPAYHENTGTVLLEAVVAGLPVMVTDICGYAHYITDANAGIVLSSPFEQQAMNHALQQMMDITQLQEWQRNSLAFASTADIYSMPQHAADKIEALSGYKSTAQTMRINKKAE